jgi:hypothetical protein
MYDIYIGHASRIPRQFTNDAALADLDALTVTIKREATGEYLTTTAQGEFHNLDVLANKIATGKYYVAITPDAAESLGVYLLYWIATYGTGGAAQVFEVGPDVIAIRADSEIPSLGDNYVSLDAVSKAYPALFDIEPVAARILQVGWLASRDVDALLNNRFSVPIRRRSDGTYDQALIDAAVAFTIARIIGPKGYHEEADRWGARAERIIESINSGRRRLEEEITAEELGFQRPQPAKTNTSISVELELMPGAEYGDVYRRTIIVQIDKAGVIGVATCKVSIDAGLTWAVAGLLTDSLWMVPSACYGLAFRFRPLASTASLALNDSWTFDAVPEETDTTKSAGGIRTAELEL